jgi:hypothetical protein
MKFLLGQVVATPNALRVLGDLSLTPLALLARHSEGDWGDMEAGDKRANDAALKDGSRIFSSYIVAPGVKVWVITDAKDDSGQRLSTTVLMPEDY